AFCWRTSNTLPSRERCCSKIIVFTNPDWSLIMIIYNTLMALAAAVSFLLIVSLGWRLLHAKPIVPTAWIVAFTALGALLAFLGAAMTVTWPLGEIQPGACCQQDN